MGHEKHITTGQGGCSPMNIVFSSQYSNAPNFAVAKFKICQNKLQIALSIEKVKMLCNQLTG